MKHLLILTLIMLLLVPALTSAQEPSAPEQIAAGLLDTMLTFEDEGAGYANLPPYVRGDDLLNIGAGMFASPYRLVCHEQQPASAEIIAAHDDGQQAMVTASVDGQNVYLHLSTGLEDGWQVDAIDCQSEPAGSALAFYEHYRLNGTLDETLLTGVALAELQGATEGIPDGHNQSCLEAATPSDYDVVSVEDEFWLADTALVVLRFSQSPTLVYLLMEQQDGQWLVNRILCGYTPEGMALAFGATYLGQNLPEPFRFGLCGSTYTVGMVWLDQITYADEGVTISLKFQSVEGVLSFVTTQLLLHPENGWTISKAECFFG